MPINEHQAKANLQALIKKYNELSPDDRKTMSEASVVRQFIDILLRDVLGWPIEDPARYRYEQVTQVGRPDMMLTPEKGGTIFVEAKRFGVIKELKEARTTLRGIVTPGQLSLPGMAVDRTAEEQQAINYAFENNGTWAILTNFEKLRLFNARRDWLVLSFETPSAYLSEFDLLWQLAYHNVLEGSLDTLSNQRLTAEVDTDYLAFINEWREKLAQDIVQHRDQNQWVVTPDDELDLPRLRAVVQRIIDRLVIVRYAEDRLVLPAGSLRGIYDVRQQSYLVDVNQMVNTLFRRFDQIHNSALFAEGLADKASFSEDVLLNLITKLYEARYRSMPADIMGNTYEQYLGKTLVRQNGSIRTADNLETRKKQGSYYTPQVIVRYIVDNSLGRYLYATENGKPDGKPIPGEERKTSGDILDLHVLDSACGSGSFLIYAYEVLNNFYESEKLRLQTEFDQRVAELAAQRMLPNDIRIELSPIQAELDRLNNHPRLILETHLYGVDLDPQAAEIAVVNLMMRGMERRHSEKRLPLILNQNVKVGNGLIGLRHDDPRLAEHAQQIAAIRQLRSDLIRFPNDGPDHDRIIRDLEAATAALTSTLNEPLAAEFDDLSVIRPFHWAVEFPEVFFDEQGQPLENPGFTLIFGNPPWEIIMPDEREFYAQFDPNVESKLQGREAESRINELDEDDPKRRLDYELQKRVIQQTATYLHNSYDYRNQGTGHLATHKLFIERMWTLLAHEARLGYLVPAGIYRDLGTRELRQMFLNEGNIQYIFSFSNERKFFPSVHHDFRFTLIGTQKGHKLNEFQTSFRFNPRTAIAPSEMPTFLENKNNLVQIRHESLTKFSPGSMSLMEFQSQLDYKIAEKLYNDWPLIGNEIEDYWNIQITQEFNMTTHNKLFNQERSGFPLYEGKMIHQYETFFAPARYWISESLGTEKLKQSQAADWFKGYRFAFRDVSNATNERTSIAATLPPNTFTGHTLWVGITSNAVAMPYLVAVLNSFCVDWLVRFKVDKHFTLFIAKQLPLPRLNPGNPYFDAIVPRAAQLTCTRPEFAALWEEVMESPWDESKGATDPAARQRLRDEIDAIVAHLYGLSRADFDHILGTFPLVFPDTESGHARRAAVLAVYDAWVGKL